MSLAQALIAHAVKLALLAALVGAFARGHFRRCWSFVTYLSFAVVSNALITTWPATYYTESYWILQQATFDVLKFAVAIELAARVVAAFPGVARGARWSALVVLTISLGVILSGQAHPSYETHFEWQPQIVAAAIWLFALSALLVAWYHLPLDAWHRSIILGFSAYLLVFVTLLNVIKHNGWGALRYASIADSLAYLALASWWTWASWQPAALPVVTAEQIEQLGSPAPRRA